MKKIFAIFLLLSLLAGLLAGCGQTTEEKVTINVYNWGQYISEGDDGCIDVIAEFEKRYPNIKVNYVTFDSNETMYTKMAGGGITVDVIIPSDYMVGRLIEEGMLLELNPENIPNAQYVDPELVTTYDPEGRYSVPYAWGTVGIIYNTKYVDEADVTGWELLWNENREGQQLVDENGDPKYAGKILMFDNSRDAFAIAQCRLGYDLNITDEQKLLECAKLLEKQRPVVQQYIMDQVFDLMENEEAWIAPYYAGDYLTMAGENENLAFYLPQDQGFNRFIDAMCIPTCCENKEAAETFINFLCDPEIAGGNMDWICYSTPIPAAKEYMELDAEMEEVNYAVEGGTGYLALPRETTRYMDSLFMRVRNGIDLEADGNGWLWAWGLAAGVIALGFAAWLLLKKRKHKK